MTDIVLTLNDDDQTRRVKNLFEQAPFIEHLGITLTGCGPGWCEAQAPITTALHQQDGVVHAGALATLNDHTAGGASATLLQEDQYILSIEFKNNMLRAARGVQLRCRAEVLKAGRSIHVVEAKTWAIDEQQTRTLVSTMTCTLMVLSKPS